MSKRAVVRSLACDTSKGDKDATPNPNDSAIIQTTFAPALASLSRSGQRGKDSADGPQRAAQCVVQLQPRPATKLSVRRPWRLHAGVVLFTQQHRRGRGAGVRAQLSFERSLSGERNSGCVSAAATLHQPITMASEEVCDVQRENSPPIKQRPSIVSSQREPAIHALSTSSLAGAAPCLGHTFISKLMP